MLQLAQWAGSRVDLFPSLLCQRLGRLHSDGKPHPFWYTKQVLERIFRRPLDQIFEQIEETPIGTGAIAQVRFTELPFTIVADRFAGVQSYAETRRPPSILSGSQTKTIPCRCSRPPLSRLFRSNCYGRNENSPPPR